MPSLSTLAKVAIGGTFLLGGASAFAQWKIEVGLKSGGWFTESMRLLHAHSGAVALLGEPIRDGKLDLGSPADNFCREGKAQFRVPVRGVKDQGHLYLWATRQTDTWQVDRLELELSDIAGCRLLVHPRENPKGEQEAPADEQTVDTGVKPADRAAT